MEKKTRNILIIVVVIVVLLPLLLILLGVGGFILGDILHSGDGEGIPWHCHYRDWRSPHAVPNEKEEVIARGDIMSQHE